MKPLEVKLCCLICYIKFDPFCMPWSCSPLDWQHRRQKGSEHSCFSLELSFQVVDIYFQNASQGYLCKYTKLTLVSKELKTGFQYINQKPRYLIESIYSGSIILLSNQELSLSFTGIEHKLTEIHRVKYLMLSLIIQFLRSNKLRLILMHYDDGD